jgi:hypothetical protein
MIAWSYLGGEEMDILGEGDEDKASRREWWYDAGNTYVYQVRQPNGSWGAVMGEYETEPLPQAVQDQLQGAGFTLCYTTDDLAVGTHWRHKKRGSEYEVTSLRVLQCAQKMHRPRDGETLVCYDSTDPDCPPEFRVWARPVDEFLDGRFSKL